MKYLYTNNATQEYRAKGTKKYFKFESIQTLQGWVGVLAAHEDLAKLLIEESPKSITEVDKDFYDEIIKKKYENPNIKVIQVSMDPTKPAHAEYREKAQDAEFVEIEEIEVREIEEKPKAQKAKSK